MNRLAAKYADLRSAHMWTCKLCVCGRDCDTLNLLNRKVAECDGQRS